MFKLVWEFEWKNVQYIECRVYFRCDGECSGDLWPDWLLEKQLKDQMVGQMIDSFRGCGSEGWKWILLSVDLWSVIM